jgi:membrane associated rhomboid family serine protease
MLIGVLLVCACIGLHVYSARYKDQLVFSGANVQQYRFVWLTATFIHESPSHLAHNMTFFMGFASHLEAMIGGIRLVLAFIACGVCGWAVSYTLQRFVVHRKEWEIARFNSSCGASPATYGLAFLTASIRPLGIVANTLWIPSGLWIAIMMGMPLLISHRPGGSRTKMSRITLGIGAVISAALIFQYLFPRIEMWEWLCLYLLQVFIVRCYRVMVLKRKHSAADHYCHLGGAFCGYLIGYLLVLEQSRFLTSNCFMWDIIQDWPDSAFDSICKKRFRILSCFVFLVFRLIENF